MRIRIEVPGPRPARWHAALAEVLAPATTSCAIRVDPMLHHAAPTPSLRVLLLLDRTLHGGGDGPFDEMAAGSARAVSHDNRHDAPDLIINLTATDPAGLIPSASPRLLVPLFDGDPNPAALWSALLDGRAPHLGLWDSAAAASVSLGQPALEAPHQLQASAASVMARLIEGIARCVAAPVPSPHAAQCSNLRTPVAHTAGSATALRHAAQTLAAKARNRLNRILHSAPQWAVATRGAAGPRSLPTGDVDPAAWRILADDGRRYYADPFIAGHAGQRALFVEEFPYATGRGIISVSEVDGAGNISEPRPIIEQPFHLSYPQVFEEDGALYMLPEAAASGRLTLYRCTAFPHGWTPVADLIEAEVHDATLVRHGGIYWIFAATRTGPSSTWDALSLFSASRLKGPWRPHAANPVLLDASAARPAGQMFTLDGQLYRPAQDCSRAYGGALSLARVDRLDGEIYRQTCVAGWRATPGFRLLGPHTWNVAAGLEAIDLFGPRAHLGLARGGVGKAAH